MERNLFFQNLSMGDLYLLHQNIQYAVLEAMMTKAVEVELLVGELENVDN